jgi:hypothetical protein
VAVAVQATKLQALAVLAVQVAVELVVSLTTHLLQLRELLTEVQAVVAVQVVPIQVLLVARAL